MKSKNLNLDFDQRNERRVLLEMLHIGELSSLYDAVSDLMHNWGPQRPDFKSALRVVKMVLNTQCYQYLWLSMWFHAKKSKETLKNSKSLILQCKFGSRAQKWPKMKPHCAHYLTLRHNEMHFSWTYCKGQKTRPWFFPLMTHGRKAIFLMTRCRLNELIQWNSCCCQRYIGFKT